MPGVVMQDRLQRLEERLSLLKAIPASRPLLGQAKRPQPSRCKCEDVPMEWSRGEEEPCVDFDFCFKFPSPCLTDFLREEARNTDEAQASLKKARQDALAEVLEKEKKEYERILQEISKESYGRTERRGGSNMIRSFSKSKPRTSEGLGSNINRLFKDCLIEARDRVALTSTGEVESVNDLRTMALSMLLDFFRREEETYQTFLFHSMDHDEIFLCVKMAEETAAEHAEASNFSVELLPDQLSEHLGIRIPPDGPQPAAFAHYSHYIAQAGLVKLHQKESDPLGKTLFRKVDRISLLYDRLTDVLDVEALRQWKLLLDFYPLHTSAKLHELKHSFGKGSWIMEPNFDDIKDYYGSQVALYFVFSSQLSKSLCWLLLAIALLAVYVAIKEQSVQEAFTGFLYGHRHEDARAAMAVILILWTQIFQRTVQSKVSWLQLMWGEDVHLGKSLVKPRFSSRFKGKVMDSEVDHTIQKLGVPEKQKVRGRHISRIATFIFGLIVSLVIVSVYRFAGVLDATGYHFGFTAAGYMVSVISKLAQIIWDQISQYLTDLEYHRLEVDYFNSWSVKTVAIQMICSFSPFVYIGFIMSRVDQCPRMHGGDCFGYLCYEMVIIFVLYIIFAFWDIFYPLVSISVETHSEMRAAKKIGHRLDSLSRIELQSKMPEYSSYCIAEDFCEQILPLAFVLLFGITLPLSPVLALISSLLQLHVDAFKLTHFMQRPYPVMATRGLGIWAEIVQLLSFVAVYTNVGIISFLLEPFASLPWRYQLLWFLGLSTLGQLTRILIAEYPTGQDSALRMAIKRQGRQKEVVEELQKHYAASLVIEKPAEVVKKLMSTHPQELLKRAEEAKQPLALRVRADLDLISLPVLSVGSKYFETHTSHWV